MASDPTDWLLEFDNPSVRYLTLTGILEQSAHDPEVKEARKAIMGIGPAPRILAKQAAEGYWVSPEYFYIGTKYKGTVWSLILLAELLADGRDERIRKAFDHVFQRSQHPPSGGFATWSAPNGGGDPGSVIPCLTGNMVWSAIRFGYLSDPRVQRGIEWMVRYQRFDDGGAGAPDSWPYVKKDNCWGKHTCYSGVVTTLKALAEIPEEKRSKNVKATINNCVDFILKHHIYKRSHDLSRVANQDWTLLGFPSIWKVDVLDILLLLTKLGCKDDRMKEAVDLILSKQDDSGRWTMERSFNGRMQVNIERKDQPSKWITWRALMVLKRYFS